MNTVRYSDIRDNLFFEGSIGLQGCVSDPKPDFEEKVCDIFSVEFLHSRSDEDEELVKVATAICQFFHLDDQYIDNEEDFLYTLDIDGEAYFVGTYLLDKHMDGKSWGVLVPNLLRVISLDVEESYRGTDVKAGLLKDLPEIIYHNLRRHCEFVSYKLTEDDMQTKILEDADFEVLPHELNDTPIVIYQHME